MTSSGPSVVAPSPPPPPPPPAVDPSPAVPGLGSVRVAARPSIFYALPPLTLITAGVGLVLFYLGYTYLTDHLAPLIVGPGAPGYVPIETLAVNTLALYIAGWLLLVFAAWRWRRALPRQIAEVVFVLALIPPLLMVATWFSTIGEEVMIPYYAVVVLALPLALSLAEWRKIRYELTDRYFLTRGEIFERGPTEIERARAPMVTLRQGIWERLTGRGTLIFGEGQAVAPTSAAAVPAGHHVHLPFHFHHTKRVEWRGLAHPRDVVEQVEAVLPVARVLNRRDPRELAPFALAVLVILPLSLGIMATPVFTVTQTVDVHCALYLGLANIKQEPGLIWPLVHNFTIPLGKVTFQWWSGSPTWILVGQLPAGPFLENANISALLPGNQGELTTSGSGTYFSDGGSSLGACAATNTGTTATLVLTYQAPLLWE
jgi:hypothetical protein